MNENNILDLLKLFLSDNKAEVQKYVLLSLTSPISEVLLPHFYGKVIDSLSQPQIKGIFENNKNNILFISGLWVLSQGMAMYLDMLDTKFIPKLTSYFRDIAVKNILNYYQEKGDDLEIGDLLCKILRLPTLIRDLFYQFRTYIIPSFLILISATSYFYYVDSTLGTLMLTGLVVFFYTLYKFAQDSINENRSSIEKFDKLHEEIIDILSNSANIHNADRLKEELKRFEEKQIPFNESLKEGLYKISTFKRLFSSTFFAIFGIISGYVMKLFSESKINAASASSVLIILLFIIVNLTDLSNNIRDFIFNISGLMEIQNFMDKFNMESKNYTQNPVFLNNTIIIKNATIVTDNNTILAKNINLNIPEGKFTVIRGRVGSGKSSILKAILKNKKLINGDILVGGVSITKLSPVDIRKYVAYVPQHPILFNRSILENILYGNKSTKEDVVGLLATYGITEIKVSDLDRNAGKNGNSLSGGQKQIVFILRFLLRNSPIILLDEPTSSLSPKLKGTILRLLNEMKDGKRTVVITTHDEDVMSLADNIIILKK